MGQTWVKHPGSSWWVAGSWTSLDLIVRLEEWLVCLTFNTIFLPSLDFVTHRKQYLSINLGFIPWIIRCRHTCGNKILRSFLQMGLYIALILHFWSILYCSLHTATDYFEGAIISHISLFAELITINIMHYVSIFISFHASNLQERGEFNNSSC